MGKMAFKTWFGQPVLPKNFPAAQAQELSTELSRRMESVQRHRLLQGFPMAPMMGESRGYVGLDKPKERRRLIVGVLPHSYCVPAVKGCGFYTFPHEKLAKREFLPLATAIAKDIHAAAKHPYWKELPAIYLGGGTANLTPLPALGVILGALLAFRPLHTEITLEGVPRFFTAEQLDLIAATGFERVRISMGVQTFEPDWIRRMGRQEIGNPEQVQQAVELAQAKGAGCSVDLLINLPGQPQQAMVADVQQAIDLGVDQICLYHLVLKPSFPVPWAQDASMMAALPDNPTAFDNWRAARKHLLAAGFVQRTLTNFERPGMESSTRFCYEPESFRPHTCDALGFGPGAISGVNFGTEKAALKWINHAQAAQFLEKTRMGLPVAKSYLYEPFEDALMQLTRGLVLLRVPTDEGALAKHLPAFEPELAVLEQAGLLTRGESEIALTEKGMFYADSVAGLLAWRTVQHRGAVGLNEPERQFMG